MFAGGGLIKVCRDGEAGSCRHSSVLPPLGGSEAGGAQMGPEASVQVGSPRAQVM